MSPFVVLNRYCTFLEGATWETGVELEIGCIKLYTRVAIR